MSSPKTTRATKSKRSRKRETLADDTPAKRLSLADDVPPSVREDGELIPGLRPALIANPGRHPSREVGRRRRSGLTVPAILEPLAEPDDTAGRVTFFFGEALVETETDHVHPEPVDEPAVTAAAEPVGWTTVAGVAMVLLLIFLLGIELLK